MVSIRNPVAHGAAPDGLTIAALGLMDNLGFIDLKFRWLHACLRECLDATGHRYSVKMKEVCKSMLPLIAC